MYIVEEDISPNRSATLEICSQLFGRKPEQSGRTTALNFTKRASSKVHTGACSGIFRFSWERFNPPNYKTIRSIAKTCQDTTPVCGSTQHYFVMHTDGSVRKEMPPNLRDYRKMAKTTVLVLPKAA